MTDSVEIEVVLALPGRCWRRRLTLPRGATAGEALRQSQLDEICRREAGEAPKLGVYGRKVDADYVLQSGERLELYRSLTADPRERRRRRVNARRGGDD